MPIWAGAAVSRVKFVQGALSQLPAAAPPPKPGTGAQTGDPAHTYQGPDGLKNALQSLARWRARPPGAIEPTPGLCHKQAPDPAENRPCRAKP